MLVASTSVAMVASDHPTEKNSARNFGRLKDRQVHRPAVTDKSHLDGRPSRSHHIALHQRRRNG